jgi:hypothetical protein
MNTYNPALWGTLSWIETVWLVINLYGFLLSLSNGRDANADLRAARALPEATGQDVEFARWMRWAEWGIALIQLINLVVGVWAAALISSNSGLEGLIFALLFIAKEAILTSIALKSRRFRRKNRRDLAEKSAGKAGGNQYDA